MPKEYVGIRDDCKAKGGSDKACKTKAAKIYNSKHPDNPVGRYTEDSPPEQSKGECIFCHKDINRHDLYIQTVNRAQEGLAHSLCTREWGKEPDKGNVMNKREDFCEFMESYLIEKTHPGFAAVQNKIASKEGVSKERAGAILAASSRNASAKAKKKNPKLKKVK